MGLSQANPKLCAFMMAYTESRVTARGESPERGACRPFRKTSGRDWVSKGFRRSKGDVGYSACEHVIVL